MSRRRPWRRPEPLQQDRGVRRPWLSCVVLRVLLNEHQVYSTGAGAIPDVISDSPRIVLTGTLVIDYVAAYPGVFSELPRHPGINLAVQLESIERRFGGCAMNIAYTLRLLGNDPVPFVYVGKDFDNEYAAHLRACGVDMSGIHMVDAPHARLRGSPISEAGRAGAVTAAMVLETAGTQTHRCEDFGARYRRSWGHLPEWSG